MVKSIKLFVILICTWMLVQGQKRSPAKMIAFFTSRNDQAHISFVAEAHQWFATLARKLHFTYDSTSNWNNLNADFLTNYKLVIFFDTRPEEPAQRKAFETYMKQGGAWLGFHFAAFALTPSAFPQNWDWYHSEFLGAGEYSNNTWRPTSAVVKVEDRKHPATGRLPLTFSTAPNEWYNWKNDLRLNPDIDILLSIDPSSFPLGTGPKPHEIWHSGYYPVAWTNRRFKMIYMNMGHNDIDYENKTNKTLSHTFSSPAQNRFIQNSIVWLMGKVSK